MDGKTTGLADTDKAAKPHLLTVLSRIGGQQALEAVREQLHRGNAEIKKAAIRSMADWPDATPSADLMKIAKSGRDSTNHVLALRGSISEIVPGLSPGTGGYQGKSKKPKSL